jgi:hypothetical protein
MMKNNLGSSLERVTFDKPKLERLKKVYENARSDGAETFVFEGKEYLTDYAKFLIEYIEHKI